MSDMTPSARLAVLTALEKAVKEQIRAARAEVDERAWQMYEDMGVEKTAVKLDGEKVGEVIMTFHSEGFEVTDPEEFEEFALDYGLARVEVGIRPDMVGSVIAALSDSIAPEVLEEVITRTVVMDADWEKGLTVTQGVVTYLDSGVPVPGVRALPKRPKGTMLRGCKPADVLPIVGRLEGGVNALLLGEAR